MNYEQGQAHMLKAVANASFGNDFGLARELFSTEW